MATTLKNRAETDWRTFAPEVEYSGREIEKRLKRKLTEDELEELFDIRAAVIELRGRNQPLISLEEVRKKYGVARQVSKR